MSADVRMEDNQEGYQEASREIQVDWKVVDDEEMPVGDEGMLSAVHRDQVVDMMTWDLRDNEAVKKAVNTIKYRTVQ